MSWMPDIPESFFVVMGWLAAIGVLSLVTAAIWALVWVVRHIRFV